MFCTSSLMRTLKNLLHFFVTLKGPRYGGCRECDLALSRTNTCVHFSRAFGTYVLMLFFFSCHLGHILVSLSTNDVTSHTFSGAQSGTVQRFCCLAIHIPLYYGAQSQQY